MKILPLKTVSDSELIAALQEGESWALKKLFTDNYKVFKAWGRKTFPMDTDWLDDIYQDSVIITYENIQHGKLNNLGSSLSTYLFAVAKNLIRQKKRKEIKFSQDEETIARELYTAPDVAIPEAMLKATKNVLLNMDEPCKSILTLFYYADKSIEEIAEALGYKDKTGVKTQKSRCLKYLRETISFSW